MHEQGETVQTPRGWQNVYGPGVIYTPGTGQPGQPLPLLFPFELSFYPTAEMGAQADMHRSELFGKLVDAVMGRHRDAQAQVKGTPPPPFVDTENLP